MFRDNVIVDIRGVNEYEQFRPIITSKYRFHWDLTFASKADDEKEDDAYSLLRNDGVSHDTLLYSIALSENPVLSLMNPRNVSAEIRFLKYKIADSLCQDKRKIVEDFNARRKKSEHVKLRAVPVIRDQDNFDELLDDFMVFVLSRVTGKDLLIEDRDGRQLRGMCGKADAARLEFKWSGKVQSFMGRIVNI